MHDASKHDRNAIDLDTGASTNHSSTALHAKSKNSTL